VIAVLWQQQHPGAGDPRFVAAHRALRGDSSLQFDLSPVTPPAEAPAWLRTLGHWVENIFRPIGRAIAWITNQMPDAPYARILLWALIVAALIFAVSMAVQRWRTGAWRLPGFRRHVAVDTVAEEEWTPEAAPARRWLEEADALAARGEYAEAIHHLLQRSVEDIARRRPKLLRPALTSRDIAASDAIPSSARALFARIAALVERSLFGGRSLELRDWGAARDAYTDFALPKAWRG
jgi:hypothetical protein